MLPAGHKNALTVFLRVARRDKRRMCEVKKEDGTLLPSAGGSAVDS